MRIIPGTDPRRCVARFAGAIVGDQHASRSKLRIRPPGPRGRRPASSEDTELYRALEREARVEFPVREVTPYLFQAGTDAGGVAFARNSGVRHLSVPDHRDELTRMHGNDERVSVESLQQGTEMIYRTLMAVAKKP